jgi:PAS domain S-box-containing protein
MEAVKLENPKSLRTTLTTSFLSLSAAFLLIAGSIEMYYNFSTQGEIIAGRQQLIAQEAAGTVAGFIREKFSVLETAVRLGNPVPGSRKDQIKVLRALLGIQRSFRHVVLLNPQERVLSMVSRLSRAELKKFTTRLDGDLFSQVRQSKRYIGAVYVDEVTSEPMVIIAVPVTDIFRNFRGILAAEVNLKFMWDLVYRMKIGETGQAYVVDGQGDLIAFGDVGRVLQGENLGHLKEVREFINNPAPTDETGASISSGINGTTIVGTYVPLKTPNWAVIAEMPVREAYREVIRSMIISAGAVLVMVVLAGLTAIYMARRLAVPLISLTATATRIAAGEIELQAATEGPAEVVSLAGAFNRMTGQLREMLHVEEERSNNLQQEITQRRQAEETLYKYRHIVSTSSDLMSFVDSNYVYQAVNQAYLKAHKKAPEEITKHSVAELHGEKFFNDVVKNKMDRCLAGEGEIRYQDWFDYAGLGRRFMDVIYYPHIDDGGAISGVVVNARDITERKQVEDELTRYREQLEELVEERTSELAKAQEEILKRERLSVLGQLTATVSHELRNPLGVIRSSAFYLQRRLRDEDEIAVKHLTRIDEQVGICDVIVGDLLEFTRGRHSDKIKDELNPWLAKLLENFTEVPEEIKIVYRLSADVPPLLFDREKMRRAVVNLVTNAIQSVSAKREEAVDKGFEYLPVVSIDTWSEPDCVIIQVEDNGTGMDEETAKRALEPLFTTKARGTGLGLAIVEKIVAEHGGNVSLESSPQEGTRVRIALPITGGY